MLRPLWPASLVHWSTGRRRFGHRLPPGGSTVPGSPLHPPPSQAHLTVDSRTDGGVVTLVVRGEIDLASAPVLEHALRDAEASAGARIVVDLGGLDFIDS